AAIKARQGVELITSGELRVVDTQGNDVPLDGATQGEIVARGNVIMAGDYNDPKATEQALRRGWFHTGDAAVVHPDGYVEIRDRLKDVIISGGENICSVVGQFIFPIALNSQLFRARSTQSVRCCTGTGISQPPG